jgi:hypothetical protein
MKKGISILLVLTMVLSMLVPFPVLGSPLPAGIGGGAPEGTMPTDGDIDGNSSVVVIDTFGDIMGGIVPTANSLDFVIDPLGLFTYTDGDADNDGNVIIDLNRRHDVVDFNHTDGDTDTLYAYNTSSAPVLLTVELTVVTDDNATVVATVDDLSTGDTDADADRTILLWMELNKAELITLGDEFVGIGEGVAFEAGATVPVQFRLNALQYQLTMELPKPGDTLIEVDYTRVPGTPDYSGTGFRFGGRINPEANWGQIGVGDPADAPNAADITINAVFRMELLEDGDTALDADIYKTTDGDVVAFGLLDSYDTNGDVYDAPTLIDLPVEAGGSSYGFAVASVNYPASNWVDVSFKLPANATIQGVTRDGTALPTTGTSHRYRIDTTNDTMGFWFATNTANRIIVVTYRLAGSTTDETFTITLTTP